MLVFVFYLVFFFVIDPFGDGETTRFPEFDGEHVFSLSHFFSDLI